MCPCGCVAGRVDSELVVELGLDVTSARGRKSLEEGKLTIGRFGCSKDIIFKVVCLRVVPGEVLGNQRYLEIRKEDKWRKT